VTAQLKEMPAPRRASPANVHNAEYIDQMYRRWQQDPATVGESWQMFFEGYSLSRESSKSETASRQSRVASLIYAYRDQGHRVAQLDPLTACVGCHPQLELEQFGLGEEDLDQVFDTGHLHAPSRAPLRDVLAILRDTYCRHVGVEYLHIQDTNQRRWLQAQMEPVRNQPDYSRQRKLEILKLLIDAELFETFIASNYPGQKRFSLEGAETLIPAIHALVELCPALGVEEVVLGMAHRGRLNVLANILDKSYATIFGEFEDNVIPEQYGGGGDVKYHKGFSSDHVGGDGRTVHLSLTANPSHLEAVDPVVEGRARAKQRRRGDTSERRKVLPLLIHGDAAFAGQGLVAETLNLSSLPGYRTGGTVHIIVNNQIGFTTSPDEARSTTYCTDVAKMIEAPIFHVNGDDPEATVFVTELALRYRQEFGKDVVVDMLCYRRHGHNEGDEPAFTQPLLYSKIKGHPSARELYTRRLHDSGDLSPEMEARIRAAFKDELRRALDEVRRGEQTPGLQYPDTIWSGLLEPYTDRPVETGVPRERLIEVATALCTVPDGFMLNPKVARQLPGRLEAVQGSGDIDWGFAEALAFGTLLVEGTPVRLSGQDSARGTFSHRHAVWTDMETQEDHTPANNIAAGQARMCVYNSLLSEAAVLGFDYGYSLVEPQMLILWEAQFGDFANGAQVIIDQFIVGGQAKWGRHSGLTMLLPHGYEGQGPEHSNAYLERYLMACAENNIQVCNPTTPAQLFHLLRRQVRRPFRRPLVVMSPKSLLRHKRCVSPATALVEGHFAEILDDPRPEAEGAERLVLCSGKVYYDLLAGLTRAAADGVAVVRVEQFYPFCDWRLAEIAERYKPREVIWVQEEPRNRGGWTFMEPRLRRRFPDSDLRYVGRAASASPAVGSLSVHREQQQKIVEEALRG
jgi:2-oxoglutarate dehydrogenase E1 component